MPRSLPPEPPGAGSVARVGLESNGGTVVLTVGLRLVVTLAANWTPPRQMAVGSGVTAELQPLRAVSSAGFPAPGVASATFMAVRPGTAAIFAVTDYPCLARNTGVRAAAAGVHGDGEGTATRRDRRRAAAEAGGILSRTRRMGRGAPPAPAAPPR